jgi:NAD(P)-dependent dehydrogenase (short-subunit alcohol dehydrogenase family)
MGGGLMKVRDKVWVVTGGGNGIGRALVMRLLEKGGRVAAVDIRADDLRETEELAAAAATAAGARQPQLSTHVVDISDRAATEALVAAVLEAHGAVDALINNAGIIQPFVPVADLDYDVIDRVLDVNLMGTIYMTKSFLPALLARPEAHLVNVSSMGGFFPFPRQTVYGASKAAVKLFTEGLYSELLDTNVRVSVVFPGTVSTGITEHSGAHLARSAESSPLPVTTPEKAARVIVAGIERDKMRIFSDPMARVMDVAVKVAPKQATRMIGKRMRGMFDG